MHYYMQTITITTSIVIGLVFGYILIKLLVPSVIYHGPDSNKVKKKVFHKDGQYFKFTTVPYVCPLGINIK